MTSYALGHTRTMRAAADLREFQWRAMRAAGAGLCNVASEAAGGANDLVGVLVNKPNSGQAATIAYNDGEVKMVAGGAITVNTWITTNGSGKAAACGSNENVIGLALETAGNEDELIRVQLLPIQPLLRT